MIPAKNFNRKIEALLSDGDRRDLIYDYLDSRYQSIPYRDSRTLLLRLVFEIGLEVFIALATFGAGNVARRAGQATAATTKAVRTSSVTKRIGPFTERAIDVMADLGRVLRKPAIKHEPPPVQKLDVPNYAKPVKNDPKISTIHDGKVVDVPNTEVDDFVSGLYRIDTPTHKASGRFEVEQTGPYNYRVKGGDTSIDIDGYNGRTMLDAKFVEKPAVSPYVDESSVPDFLRTKILKEQQNEVQRYNKVIKDPKVPFNSLDILTNEPKAVPYFQSLMDRYQVPGSVKLVDTQVPQIIPGGGNE